MVRREDGPSQARPVEAVPPPAAEDPTWGERLEDQLGWYDRKSGDNQRHYKRLKLKIFASSDDMVVHHRDRPQ
jgi:hypothetical protein